MPQAFETGKGGAASDLVEDVSSAPHRPADLGAEGPEFKIDSKLLLATLFLLVGYEGSAFSLVLVAPIMTYINNDIGPVPYYAWIAICWSIGNGICITVAGRVMDIWGRRWPMIVGHLLGLTGNIIAAVAENVGQVIAGVTIAGVGAGLQQQATACLAELVPRKYRPATSGLVTAALLISTFGAPIAYTFVQQLSWRWSFYTSIIANGIAFLGTFAFYFPPTFQQKHRGEELTKMQEFARSDFFGLCLFVGSLVSLTMGINWGGTMYPWTSSATVAPIVVGIVGILSLGIWEKSPLVKEPLVPPILAKDVRGFVMIIIVSFVAGMLLYSLISFWPLQVASMYSSDLNETGWLGMISYGSSIFGGFLIGSTVHKLRHSKWILIGTTTVMTVFIASMAAMTPDTRPAAIAIALIGSLAVGVVQVLCISVVVVRIDDAYIGTAVGLLGTSRLVGGAIATAIYSSVLSNKVAEVLPSNVAASVLPLGLEENTLPALIQALVSGSPTALSQVPGATAEIIDAAARAVRVSYGQGFRLVYLVSISFGICAIIATFFTRGLEDMMTNELSIQLNPVKPAVILRIDHANDEEKQKSNAKEGE